MPEPDRWADKYTPAQYAAWAREDDSPVDEHDPYSNEEPPW